MGLTPTSETVDVLEDRSWMGPAANIDRAHNRSKTLDGDSVRTKFAAGTFLRSGTCLAEDADTKKAVLYAGTSEEVQRITISGGPTGGTYVLHWNGQDTAAIAFDASAAAVQAALEALSNIAVGDVAVTGSAGGPYNVKFQGNLANADEAAITATASLTGGSSPAVAITTPTAGGADLGSNGSGTGIGHLDSGQTVPATGDMNVSVYVRGQVVEANLPAASGIDPAFKADLAAHIQYL